MYETQDRFGIKPSLICFSTHFDAIFFQAWYLDQVP